MKIINKSVALFLALILFFSPIVSLASSNESNTHIALSKIMSDTLPSDGCQHTVVIGGEIFSLDEVSYSRIQSVFSKIPYGAIIRQKIGYTKTGKMGTVQCGWGTSQQYPQIHIHFAIPKK